MTEVEKEELGVVTVIKVLRTEMSPARAYYVPAIAKMIDKSLPATRRYLRILENLGLLIVKRQGPNKLYCLPEALQGREKQ